MQRIPKNKYKKCGWYFNTKFSDKIALMYGGILSILVVFSSMFVTISATGSYLNMRKAELESAADLIAAEVSEKSILSQEEVDELNIGQNIHASIYDVSSMIDNTNIDIVTTPSGTSIKIDRTSFNHQVDEKGEFLAKFMVCIRPVNINGDYYMIIIEKSYANEIKVIRTFLTAFFIFAVIGITGSAFIGRYISKLMLKPIILITETAASIGFEDLNRRIDYEGPDDEVKVLADTFNDMISRLQEAFEKQTRFISDASHELRTPISVIQGYANLIDRWGKEDPDILQESIGSIKDETEHMSSLIKNLLALAKYQQSLPGITGHPLNLLESAREVAKEYNVMGTTSAIICLGEEDIFINGNLELVSQMIRIFVDNSIKYSYNLTHPITIKVANIDGRPCLSISDQGVGIAEKDIPHIFERFFRADESRSKEIPGTGIGLSIADTIIQNHGGKAFVESELGKGTTISVKFPPIE